MSKPMHCVMCSYVASEFAVLNNLQVSTLPAQRHGPVDCQHEAESVSKCPGCGAIESFVPATVCGECDCYPCECNGDVVWLRKVTGGKAVQSC